MNGNRWRHLQLRDGAHWPEGADGRRLLKKLNNVAQDLNRTIYIVSGLRTPYEQHVSYMDYLHGGNLAAPCGWKHYLHDWSVCPRQPTSNHCFNRAVDCGVLGNSGAYHSIGLYKGARESMRRHGLCLPVPGEQWHVQVGDLWRV